MQATRRAVPQRPGHCSCATLHSRAAQEHQANSGCRGRRPRQPHSQGPFSSTSPPLLLLSSRSGLLQSSSCAATECCQANTGCAGLAMQRARGVWSGVRSGFRAAAAAERPSHASRAATTADHDPSTSQPSQAAGVHARPERAERGASFWLQGHAVLSSALFARQRSRNGCSSDMRSSWTAQTLSQVQIVISPSAWPQMRATPTYMSSCLSSPAHSQRSPCGGCYCTRHYPRH